MNGTLPMGPMPPDQGGPAPMPDNKDTKPATLAGSPIGPSPEAKPPVPPTPPTPPTFPTFPTPPMPPQSRPIPPAPPAPPQPSGTLGGIQAPPAQEVDIRTMRKDAEAFKLSGGTGVASGGTFNPVDLTQEASPIISVDTAPKVPAPKTRVLIISIAVAVVLALAAAAVYFFVLPLFTDESPEVVVEEEPGIEEEIPEAEESVFTHESFFTGTPNLLVEAYLESITVNAINAAVVADGDATGVLDETVFIADGTPIKTSDIMGLFLPGLDSSAFSDDFTAFVYRDANGDWPGYVFLLDEAEDANEAVADVSAQIEERTSLGAFYVTDPGAASAGGFKDGAVSEVSSRYLSFALAGASFNYGWSGRYLIVSTSFAGFREATELLPR